MLEEIWLMHHHINNFRNEDAHKEIVYQESRICLRVIELCNEQNIAVLPIHDSMIVQKQHESTLNDIMKQAYGDLGFVSMPNITTS